MWHTAKWIRKNLLIALVAFPSPVFIYFPSFSSLSPSTFLPSYSGAGSLSDEVESIQRDREVRLSDVVFVEGAGDMDQFILTKTVPNSRRRRLKIRRLRYTCRTKTTHIAATVSGCDNSEKEAEKMVELNVNGATTTVKYNGAHGGGKTGTDSSTEISLSISATTSSSSALSSTNNVVLNGVEESEFGKSGSVRRISYGSVSVRGRRREMEDAVTVELGFVSGDGEKFDFFGVYDGHGGARVAEACKERLHRGLEEEIMTSYDKLKRREDEKKNKVMEWEEVMERCFGRMDEGVDQKDRMIGSTAVVAVVGKEVVVVANCGDSRAVLCKGGAAVPLSVDHKPDRPDELERVEAAGGRVINWNGHRVLGVLATSRSIGDWYLKPYVISKPEVTVNKRTEEDDFLILASDGLWDVISNELACQVVRRCLTGRMRRKSEEVVSAESRAAEAAAVLVELAMARGSGDNISVIVIDLKNCRHFSS